MTIQDIGFSLDEVKTEPVEVEGDGRLLCVDCGADPVFEHPTIQIFTDGKCIGCFHANRDDVFNERTPKMSELRLAPPAMPIIRGVLDVGTSAMMIGDGGVGKTFVALDMGFCVAHGIPFMDRETPKANVLYVSNEGTQNLYKRVKGIGLAKKEQLQHLKTSIKGDYWRMDEDAFRFYFPHNPLWNPSQGGNGAPTDEFWNIVEFALANDSKLVFIDTFWDCCTIR